jgi:CrcB protein
MRQLLLVAAGGAAGSVARYLVGQALAGAPAAFPWGTLAVNAAGSLLLGVVLALWPAPAADARLLLGVGVCGGFTTFSAFAAELVALPPARAAGYAALSLALGVAAVLAGLALGRALAAR